MKQYAKFLIILAVLLLGILVAYFTLKKESITIGFSTPLSGPSSELGFSSRNAFIMAVDEYNDEVGNKFDKIKVDYVIEDDQGNSEGGLTAINALLEQDINLILGHITSASGKNSIPHINDVNALLISPLISHNGYMGVDDHFISIMPAASNQGTLIANHIMKHSKAERTVFLFDPMNKEFSNSVYEGAQTIFSLQGKGDIIRVELNKDIDFVNVVEEVMAYEPTEIIAVVHVSNLVALNNQIRKLDSNLQIYSSMWAMVPSVIEGYGDDLAGVFGVSAINPHVTLDRFIKFKESYYERYKVPADFSAIYTYDATKMLLDAISYTKDQTPDSIKKWILDTSTFTGVNAAFNITANGDADRIIFIVNAETGEIILE